MIRITVITITYNASAVLQRTLDSLLCQDYAYVEHVVVDGASKDQTVKMVEAYQTQVAAMHPDWTLKLQSEPDGGLTLWITKEISSSRDGCNRQRSFHGNLSAKVCWFAISRFMPVLT